MTKEICIHDWSYAPCLLTSDPPQQDRICRLCGKQERIRIGERSYNDYGDILNKFKKKV